MIDSNRNKLPFESNLPLTSHAWVIMSGKWRLYTILTLGERTLRYSQLSDQLTGLNEKPLASALKALVALGVMTRKLVAEMPLRVAYTLTERGRQALPILRQVQSIGQLFN